VVNTTVPPPAFSWVELSSSKLGAVVLPPTGSLTNDTRTDVTFDSGSANRGRPAPTVVLFITPRPTPRTKGAKGAKGDTGGVPSTSSTVDAGEATEFPARSVPTSVPFIQEPLGTRTLQLLYRVAVGDNEVPESATTVPLGRVANTRTDRTPLPPSVTGSQAKNRQVVLQEPRADVPVHALSEQCLGEGTEGGVVSHTTVVVKARYTTWLVEVAYSKRFWYPGVQASGACWGGWVRGGGGKEKGGGWVGKGPTQRREPEARAQRPRSRAHMMAAQKPRLTTVPPAPLARDPNRRCPPQRTSHSKVHAVPPALCKVDRCQELVRRS
jgi:hypothetical protein